MYNIPNKHIYIYTYTYIYILHTMYHRTPFIYDVRYLLDYTLHSAGHISIITYHIRYPRLHSIFSIVFNIVSYDMIYIYIYVM